MEKLVYRVYEGEIIPEGEKFVFCVSSLREISLREEIRKGERLMKIGKLVLETDDPNEGSAYTEAIHGQSILI